MTSSATGERARQVATRRTRQQFDAARIGVTVGRALWRADRATAELRWAGITFAAMGSLAIIARLIDVADRGYDRAIVINVPAAIVAVALGWSRLGPRLMARRGVRWAIGPLVVAMAMVASGAIDPRTMLLPSAAPLVILALSYAAITPGYPVAALLVIAGWIRAMAAHLEVTAQGGADNLVSDDFVINVAVVLLAATGLYLVVRIASDAESRAVRLAARSHARVDTLEALERIVRRFDGSRPVAEIMQSVVDDIATSFQIPLVSIYLPTLPTRLSMVGVAGYHSPFHEIDIGVGIIGRAGATLQTQYIPDVLSDPDYRAARDDVRSEVATPIVHAGALHGVVNFEGTLAYPMGTSHVAIAEMLARSIAAALHASRLGDERRDRLHSIERVLEVSRGLVGDLDRERTTHRVVEAAADLLAASTVFIAIRGDGGAFRVEAEVIAGEAAAAPAEAAREASARGSGRPLDGTDAAALEAVERREPITQIGMMALPIEIDGQIAAVLVATRPAGTQAFGEMERRIADLLGTQVAVALRNADRHASMRDAAVRDPLTGLVNRRYFDEAVGAAFANARRTGMPLSLIMLDLDRFSAVNNDHGHTVGDTVLRQAARAIADSVRVGDTVARFGGEEFVVIAPTAHAAEAVVIAERIRDAVAALTVPVDDGEVRVTVSAGVASLTEDEVDGKALFRAADSALLAAKRAGRDRVVAV